MKISIIILTKNAGNLFQEVLYGLFCCRGIEKTEIILIDSGSQDQTLLYAARYPQIQVHQILSREFGHGKTRNLGAKIAKGDILLYLVQDATPATPDFMQRLVAPLSNPSVAGVYAKQVARDSANPIERFFLLTTYPDLLQTRTYKGNCMYSIRSIFFSNVAAAIRRDVWEQFPFEEDLIMSEDQQWAKDVLKGGYSIVYEPAAAVLHSHNYGLKQVFRRNLDSGASLRGIVCDTFFQMATYELNFIRAGVSHLARIGKTAWVPYFFLHEAVRSVGFAIGQKSNCLPSMINYYLSLHNYYWRMGK